MEKFPPFAISVDGILGREVRMLLKQITRCLATKGWLPPSQLHNYVHTHMGVAIDKATHRCIQGLHVPSYMDIRSFSPFEYLSGLSLHQNIPDLTQPWIKSNLHTRIIQTTHWPVVSKHGSLRAVPAPMAQG